MKNIDPRLLYTDTITTSITAFNTPFSVEKQMLNGYFRVFGIEAEVFDTNGAVIDTVEERGDLTLEVESRTAPKKSFTQYPIGIFTLNKLGTFDLFRGWRFTPRQQTTWIFTLSQINSQPPTAAVTVRVTLFGYQENIDPRDEDKDV